MTAESAKSEDSRVHVNDAKYNKAESAKTSGRLSSYALGIVIIITNESILY